MSASAKFLKEIEQYLKKTGTSASAFGEAVMNDKGFVKRLRDGRKPSYDTVEHVRGYIKKHAKEAV